MNIFLLLLLALALYLIWPLVRIGWKIYKVRRQFRQAYEQADAFRNNGSAHRESSARGYRDGYNDYDDRRRKKIDPDCGEYVDFEEVEVDPDVETERQYREVDYERQQQITDAEWEEIK